MDDAFARETDPVTSHEAAASVDATRLEGIVLAAIIEHPLGLTSYEASEILGIPQWTVSPRFAPLARKSLIHDSGEKRLGDTNRRRIVWKLGPPPPKDITTEVAV